MMIREEAKIIFSGDALKHLDQIMEDANLPSRSETLRHAIRALRSLRKIAKTVTRLEQQGSQILVKRNGKLYDITRIVQKMAT
jgi:metal-responsive CopG/Arc/MetJ family transcriptional regulator